MKKQPHKRPGLNQLPPAIDCGSGYSWLPFFLMALGAVGATASAQERVLSNYYWIRPQEEPVHATRVIKVLGEKGEKYNEEFSEAFPIQNHASIQQGRLARLRALRQEAMELARRFKEAGKTPEVAYEDAWTQVYTRNLLSANGGEGDNCLDSLLRQLVEGESDLELSVSDAQWLLEALIEDDSRLDSEEGRLLLSKLSERLRVNGSDLSLEKYSAQDELMHTFADALVSGKDSMDAYREALFKVNRGFIMNHPLVGYRAPWGLGLSRSKAVYQQAKNPTPSQTISSANTQAQTVPFENLHVGGDEKQISENISAGLNPDAGKIENFLATSPLLPEEDEQDESKKELDERAETEETEKGATAAAPAPPLMMMRSARFSLRSAASPVADSGPELQSLTWAGSTGNDTWLVNGDSAATPWQGDAVYTDGSHVTFSSTSAVKDVKLDGTVRPGSITVSGTTPGTSDLKTLGYTYAFTDHGSIGDYSGGVTSINIEGSATLVLNTANTFRGGINMAAGTTLYLGCDDAAGTGTITMGDGAKLIVNYNSTDAEYRSPSVANTLNLSGTTAVSFGTASYGDGNKLPCEWRTVNLTGGVTGSGTLELRGYTYLSKSEDGSVIFNYVSDFAVNRQNAGEDGFFTGTVKLKNEFNSFDLAVGTNHELNTTIKDLSRKVLAGAVQLTLVDDVFSQATLNLTRDVSENRIVGHSSGASDAKPNKAVTSDNIVLLSNSSQIKLKALEADFLNRGWKYDEKSNGKPLTLSYGEGAKKDYSQAEERWNVRIVTDGYTNLVLEDSSNTEHVFSGSMGFAHSYVNATQAYIGAIDPADVGGGSKGVENLSLEKRGAASQYIHSAKLYNLSIAEGTLGFNNLSVSGRLLINAGSELRLGVTDVGTGTNAWESLSGVTNTSLTVGSGQLEVRTSSASKQAKVDGDLVLGASADGSMLTFDIHGIMPSTEKSSSTTILDVAGTLSLWEKTAVTINFSDINLSEHYNEDFTYYLASAGSINIQNTGTQDASFNNQIISLGAGYYGKLSVVERKGNDSKWYLALNVVGDPRRTWSGMVSERNGSYISNDEQGLVWTTASSSKNEDYQWKENDSYVDGLLTLFGNLYQPVEWVDSDTLTSSKTVHVRGDKLHTGNPIAENESGFSIDGQSAAVEGFQKVKIVGTVRPAAIFIGSDYTLHSVTDGVVSTVGKNEHDDTNYYFYTNPDGDGSIAEAGDDVLHESFSGSSTSLRKMGYGTAVIATNNSFEGGTVLEGGRIVMQHYNALGTGEITIYNTTLADAEKQNIPILQGDFSDDRDAYGLAGLSSYVGEGMDTSTIHNTVNVLLQTGAQGGVDTERVDARIANAHDKKLILRELKGDYGSVVSLYGHSSTSGQYTYAVFKVLNPSEFYGTIVMDGNILGAEADDTGGKVQMEIMTTEKSAEGADWLNTVIDLSIRNGTERTVLALDAMGGDDKPATQDAQVDALTGGGSDGQRINSSVVNMSHDKAVTLVLEGLRGGEYAGVLGFGEFQKTLNYAEDSGYAAGSAEYVGIGDVAHHYGRIGSAGELNVLKKGNSLQSVNSAVLNTLEVQNGYFHVDEALVASNLKSMDGTHILVGEVGTDRSHALVVGRNGILALDSKVSIGSKDAVDAFANLGAGVPMSLMEDVSGSSTSMKVVDPSSFVLFTDGATITAHGDWYTDTNCKYQSSITVAGTTYTSAKVPVSIDIDAGASVTINTHNYTPDATINASNDMFGRYNSSHVIQLLGEMEGHDVHLTFNNELISAAAQKDGSAGSTGSMMGYAAIRDLHQFSGDSSVTVKAMTTLQVNGTSDSSAASADEPAPMYEEQLVVNVQGNQSAIQFTDAVFTNDREYQVDKVTLENGGHVLIGGALKNTTSADKKNLDMSGVETAVTHRGAETASITNLNMKDSGTQVKLGGSANNDSVVTNASISTKGPTTDLNLEIHHAELHSSLVQLHEHCSLNLEKTVLVDKDSAVQGAAVQNAAISAAELQGPLFPTEAGNEVSSSAATVVQLTLTNTGQTFTDDDTKNKVLVLQMNQFQGVNVTGYGLTLQLTEQSAHFLDWGYNAGAQYVAIQVSGGSGWFLFEEQDKDSGFASGIDTDYKLMGADGVQITGTWVTATTVGSKVSTHLLYFNVPEPTTTTLSLLALTALVARRRRN